MTAERGISLAIVGATGVVGREMIEVIEERQFPYSELVLLASSRSAGEIIEAGEQEYSVQEINENSFDGIDIALFSAGASVSEKFAPIAKSKGTVVIDNSSFFRMA
jgi:aspartate-semialdehyde dehydrogenase